MSLREELREFIHTEIQQKRNTKQVRQELIDKVERWLYDKLDLPANPVAYVPDLGRWMPINIKCDEENNPPEVMNGGTIAIEVYPPELLDQKLPIRTGSLNP